MLPRDRLEDSSTRWTWRTSTGRTKYHEVQTKGDSRDICIRDDAMGVSAVILRHFVLRLGLPESSCEICTSVPVLHESESGTSENGGRSW